MPSTFRAGLPAVADWMVWTFLGVVVGLILAMLPARQTRNDFAHYYAGSRLLWAGHDPYQTRLAESYAAHGFEFETDVPVATNPPALLWFFLPWACLPVPAAYWAWVALQAGSLLVLLWCTRRLLTRELSPRVGRWWGALVVASPPVFWHFYYSQSQLLLAALLAGGLLLRRRQSHGWAVLVVALAGLLKVFPLVLLPWFVWAGPGQWRASGRRALLALSVLLAGVSLTRPELWVSFAQHAIPQTRALVAGYLVFSVPSLIVNLAPASFPTWPADIAGLAVVAAAYVIVWRHRDDDLTAFSVLSVAMLAGGWTTRGHYLVLLALPVAVAAVNPSRRRLAGLLVAVLLLNKVTPWPTGDWYRAVPVLKVGWALLPLWGMAVLLGLLVTGNATPTGRTGSCPATAESDLSGPVGRSSESAH